MIKKKNLIIEFKKKLITYDELNQNDYLTEDEEVKLKTLREWLSQNIPVVSTYIHEVGEKTSIYYSPPPAVGGMAGSIDLLFNLFQLDQFGIEMNVIFDLLNRSLGRYDYKIQNRWKNWINPFFWIGELIRLPFKIIKFAGFDSTKFEFSWFGKIYKLLVSVGLFIGFLSTIYANLKPTINTIFNLNLP